MIFFREIIKLLKDGESISIAITKTDTENLAVSISTASKGKKEKDAVRPVMLKGKVDDLDEEFTTEFTKSRGPLPDDGKLKSNASDVVADTEVSEEEEDEKTVKKLVSKAGTDKKVDETTYNKLEKDLTEEMTAVNPAVLEVEKLLTEDKAQEALDLIKPIAEKYPKNKFAGKALKDTEKALKDAGKKAGKKTAQGNINDQIEEVKSIVDSANAFAEESKFVEALFTIDAGLKKFSGNTNLLDLRNTIAGAKASAELNDEEDVKVPAKKSEVPKESTNVTARMSDEPGPIGESTSVIVATTEADDEETIEIPVTAIDEDDDF